LSSVLLCGDGGIFPLKNEKAAQSIMTGGLLETKAMPKHRLLAGFEADHTREPEEEERSSGLYNSEAGHP
jgi:hypothetical protein